MAERILSHRQLRVYQRGFSLARRIFELSTTFPSEEKFALTDQVRRASRAVCSLIAEAWRRRRYPAAFVNKLNEAEGEAAETQTWLEFAEDHKYISREAMEPLLKEYEHVISELVKMAEHPERWSWKPSKN